LVEIDPATVPRDPTEDPLLEPHLLVPSPQWLRARETDWAKLLTIASKAPEREKDKGPWTVCGEVMPDEHGARQELQEIFLGPGSSSVEFHKRKCLVQRLRERVRRQSAG
jgi:hypothetical protein